MLRVALAGLVLNKVISLEEAEKLDKVLEGERLPDTVKETIERIKQVRKELSKSQGEEVEK